MTNWIKCSERLPEPFCLVMLYSRFFGTFIGWMHGNGCGWCVLERKWMDHIGLYTHWMPLPEPPSEEE